MKNFQLPKSWFIKGDHTNKEVKEAWNNLYKELGQSSNYNFQTDCYYYLTDDNRKSYSRVQPIDHVEITHDEFLNYVIGKEPIKPFTQDSEYNELLIKLLKDE